MIVTNEAIWGGCRFVIGKHGMEIVKNYVPAAVLCIIGSELSFVGVESTSPSGKERNNSLQGIRFLCTSIMGNNKGCTE